MTKTLKHTTVTVTEAMIRRHNPCLEGIEAALPFLPAIVSTDVEENFDLACKLADTEQAHADAITYYRSSSTLWYVWGIHKPNSDEAATENMPYIDKEEALTHTALDAYVTAQHLAAIADALDLKRRAAGAKKSRKSTAPRKRARRSRVR